MSESESELADGLALVGATPSSTPRRLLARFSPRAATAATITASTVSASTNKNNIGRLIARFRLSSPPSSMEKNRQTQECNNNNNTKKSPITMKEDDSNDNSSIYKKSNILNSMGSTDNLIENEDERDNTADVDFAIKLRQYEICETIDDSMLGLHAFASATFNTTLTNVVGEHMSITATKAAHQHSFDYDWILDGTDDSDMGNDDEEEKSIMDDAMFLSKRKQQRKRRDLGDVKLDIMLGRMELESSASSYDATTANSSVSRKRHSSCCGSVSDGGKDNNGVEVSTEEEMVEFGDFSNAFSAVSGEVFDGDDDMEHLLAVSNMVRNEEVVRTRIKKHESIFSTGITPQSSSLLSDVNRMILSPTMASGEDDDEDEIEDCKLPQSIECLVVNLDAELDAAIANCLHSSSDKSSDSVSEDWALQDGNSCSHLLEANNVKMSHKVRMTSFQQSILMSSVLLESLPLPMPSSLADDPVASFTRRIQKYHMVLHEDLRSDFDAAQSIVRIQDEKLEQKLSDTIHCGYFEDSGTDYVDPIVMEEILNVPWPFHVIDLNESFLNDEDTDTDERSIDDLHFDTYISNRLAELDFASGEVMDCLLKRVYQQEEAINNGVKDIFAAEVAISTAILYSNSCKEFMHRARKGYQLPANQDLTGQHNVISASLNVLRIADNKDRLQYLLATVDEISSLCDKEVQWLQDVTSNSLAHHGLKKILADAKGMRDMVPREEVLNRITCLSPMRVRLNRLPEVLLERIEESLAHLFSRVLQCDKHSAVAFDAYRTEYESILDAWLSCFQMTATNYESAPESYLSAIEKAWYICVIKILCFEAKKAVAFSLIDALLHEQSGTISDGNSAMEEIQMQLSQTRFNLTDDSTLESLSQRLMRLRGDIHSIALSSPFFYLGSRLVELMNLYDMTLHWLESSVARVIAADVPRTFMLPMQNKSGLTQSDYSEDSSLSSEKQLSSSSDEEPRGENMNEGTSSRSLPENIEFKRHVCCSTSDEYKSVLKVTKCIRRTIWENCELALIQLVKVYVSQAMRVVTKESTDSATRNFHSTYDLLMQFTTFSCYFLSKVEDDGSKQCSALESELSKVYLSHLRSVHVEAMKTTGTILRHEAWLLAPLELPRYATTSKEKNCKCMHSQQHCALCKETTIRNVYQAVGDLLLSSVHDTIKPEPRRLITKRAEDSGYRQLSSFGTFLDNLLDAYSDNIIQQSQWQAQGCGIASDEFVSAVLPFVEMNDCGKRTISILTQSSSNGLVRWATRLMSIGNALPLVMNDASAAVMTLIDLYVLTVFRFCAGSKLNEDVLIGFGRGTAVSSAASTSVSLTMEADAVAPLPRERQAFIQTQKFITSSRNRLKDIVNLDKFQSSSDTCPTSPRSKNVISDFARRLEKEAAAACSCFFVALLVDVASTIFSDGKDQPSQQQPLWVDLKDMAISIEKQATYNDLKQYAADFVAVVPTLVAQTTRFAAVNSISGKELIFQIMCCGRIYENQNMQEHSNAYVDSLCERSASLWGHLSSSATLPPPVLHYTWNHLIWSAFMLLLEGFSKVNCSMEGRSLMSMDLATLSHGLMPNTLMAELEDELTGIGPPPQICREGMMRYVDTFIKVFYFPNEDILSWIKVNSENYHLDHSMSLLKASGSKDTGFLAQGKQAIDAIYSDHLRQ